MTNPESLAQAAQRESEAETFYWKQIGAALANRDLGTSDFFYRMSDFRRQQVETIMEWAEVSEHSTFGLSKVNGATLDDALNSDQPYLDLNEAMNLALSTESKDEAFFRDLACSTENPKLREAFEQLADAHQTQVQALERYKGKWPY